VDKINFLLDRAHVNLLQPWRKFALFECYQAVVVIIRNFILVYLCVTKTSDLLTFIGAYI